MKKYFKLVMPVGIMIIIMSVVYFMLGMYPFGNKSIVRVDVDLYLFFIEYMISCMVIMALYMKI